MRSAALPMALFVLALLAGNAWAGSGFTILKAELLPQEQDYVLNADLSFEFSATAIEALDNGVPLTLVLRLRIDRERAYWWNERIAYHRRRVRIRYHPLAKLFQLSYADQGTPQNFTSLSALLEALGTIRRLPVAPSSDFESGVQYQAKLDVSLDIEALPLPLRPVAYVSPSWYLSSPWYRWSFQKSD